MNNMKKNLLLFLTLCACVAFGQEDRRSQIKSMKTAYLTEELNLSSNEAEKFWPIYNAYRKDLWKLSHEKYKTLHDNYKKPLEEITTSQALKMLELAKQKEKDIAKLQATLQEDLLKVLPAPKVFMLPKVEEGFKRELLYWYSQKKE